VDGCPGTERLGALADLLGDLLVIQRGGLQSKAYRLADGRVVVRLPPKLTCHELDEDAFHELSHMFLGHGLAARLRAEGEFERAAAAERTEEREVEDFLLAFLLPSPVVYLTKRDMDLAEASGCSLELVRLRKERLAGKVTYFEHPAQWAASPHFDLTRWDAPQSPAIRIRERDNGSLFEVPTNPDDIEELIWRINAELAVFTYDEFLAKYRRLAVPPERSARIPGGEMAAWRARLDQARERRLVGGAA
jgi:hypothetical protein